MSKKVTVTKEYIDSLKSEIKSLRAKIDAIDRDRSIHRNYFIKILKTAMANHGSGNGTSSSWLIDDLSKHLNKVESWYW